MTIDFEKAANRLAAKPVGHLFPSYVDRVRNGNCATCNNPVNGFTDELSVKEFYISGMCDFCQREFFDNGLDM